MNVELSPEQKRRVDEVIAYAAKPEHWYVPGGGICPGDNPEHLCVIDPFRCCFTYTVFSRGAVTKHLTVSRADRLPTLRETEVIAQWFGMEAPGVGQHLHDPCLVAWEKIQWDHN